MTRSILVALLALSFSTVAQAQSASFERLELFGGGAQAAGTSEDGTFVVGNGAPPQGGVTQAYRWTDGSALGLGVAGGFTNSYANDVSADGLVVVGYNLAFPQTRSAFRWTASGGMQTLGTGDAVAVSADGTVVVGTTAFSQGGVDTYRWTAAEGMQPLGALPDGNIYSRAFDASASGNEIVGTISGATSNNMEAFRWTPSTGVVSLGPLPDDTRSEAFGVSPDGQVVVGRSGGFNRPNRAFRWSASQGMQDLGAPTNGFNPEARAASVNGEVVIGLAERSRVIHGTYWSAERGMQWLDEELVRNGLDLTGLTRLSPSDISADGQVIVGTGFDSVGRRVAWRAVLPQEPGIRAPEAREIVEPGEPYTVRFEANGAAAIDLFLVQKSTSHTGARTLIEENIPTASGTYVWEVPEDLLSPSTFLIAVDAADPSTEFRSERFRVRARWQLYRVAGTLPSPEYEPFEATRHVWGFAQQSAVLWPRAYWDREENDYDDGFDPFYAVPSDAIGGKVEYNYSIQNWVNGRILVDDEGQRLEFNRFLHPQWRVFVDAFGPDFVYVSPEPREAIRSPRGAIYQSNPNPSAFAVWKEAALSPTLSVEYGTYEGACFGYALTVLGAFGDPERFQSRFPTLGAARELGTTALSDAARDAIHSAHQYQYSNDGELEDLRRDGTLIGGAPETPRDVLREVKTMLALDNRDSDVILSFSGRYRADDGTVKTGAHAVAPFRLERITDEGEHKLYVIDPNRGPDETLYIRLDSLANTWSFQDGTLEWMGTNTTGLHSSLDVRLLYDRASPPQFGTLATSMVASLGGSEADLMRVAVTGATQQLEGAGGAIVFDGSTYTDGLDSVLGRFEETGGPSAPFAFLAEPGAYTLRLGSPDGSPVRAQATHGGRSVAYDRATEAGGMADQIQLASADRLFVQMNGGTGSLAQLDAWAIVGDTYRMYSATGIDAGRARAASVDANDDDVLGLTCQGGCDYDLSIESVTGAARRSFYHGDVPLAAGATHSIRPDWGRLGDGPVTVEVDTDSDGIPDETMTLEPQPFPVAEEHAPLASEALTLRTFPNPASGLLSVEGAIPEASIARVTVHDALGREVAVLQDGPLAAGLHVFSLDTVGLAPGLYDVRLTTPGGTAMRRVTVVR